MRPVENSRAVSTGEAQEYAAVTESRASEILRSREEMLVSIRPLIPTALYETLLRKINHEYASFIGIVKEESAVTETRKKMNRTLKSEYFVQKRLETNTF